MNKATIIGNLTKDPVLRSTQDGTNVCSFTVAVNRQKTAKNPNPGADFFDISAWREKGELCAKYLTKGSKVCIIGPVSVRTYQANDGSTRANLVINAETVEFLTKASAPVDAESGMDVVETDDLPFDR